MPRVLKTLRAVQWSMLVSILLYAIVGEVLGPRARAVAAMVAVVVAIAVSESGRCP